MKIAFKEAQKAFRLGEMPVGAIVVKNGRVIGKGYNKKEKTKNAIMHAEIIAINKACNKNKDWRLNECQMYVTLEPCTMCMGAIVESRIKKLYCGIENKKSHLYNQQICSNENIDIKYGMLENEIIIQVKCLAKRLQSSAHNGKIKG